MSMVEQELSVISHSSVNSSPSRLHNHFKRNEFKFMTGSSRYRGVSRQNNGHWGAQIYVNQQRIWLGTFKSEEEAAMAYDSVAIKLRNGGSYRNFSWTSTTVWEPDFQRHFDVESILIMIKNGSYMDKFYDYLRARLKDGRAFPTPDPVVGIMGQELFQKELTPSDVGKLNRLVIPKKFAVKFLPSISENQCEQNGVVVPGLQDIDVYFYDISRRSWKFRYCYWKSSQSFVFTRGWKRFVIEKELKAKDIVVFSLLEDNLMINVRYNEEAKNNIVEGASKRGFEMMEYVEEEKVLGKTLDYFANNETMNKKLKSLRLFGVDIV